ncbi:hypothetical protein [Lysinibacillus sp. NPDC093692]|uniref:hypothetical protein n=1 Tax=Lysinibacillus sp. NPDC093692 TaxID=3390578 RepID=UPI003CFFA49D
MNNESLSKQKLVSIISQDVWGYAQVDFIKKIISIIDVLTIEVSGGTYEPSDYKIDILNMPTYPYKFLIFTRMKRVKVGVELLRLVAHLLSYGNYISSDRTPEEVEIVSRL